jgi:hypothetical protein
MDGRIGGPQAAHLPIASKLTATGKTLAMHVDSYNSATVPACCPDRHDDGTGEWTDGSYAPDLAAQAVTDKGAAGGR